MSLKEEAKKVQKLKRFARSGQANDKRSNRLNVGAKAKAIPW